MNYSYEVVRVDEGAKCMDVQYTANGFDPVTVGVRLPLVGENVSAVIESFAPISFWQSQTAEYATVSVGTQGSYTQPTQEQTQQEQNNLQMWAQIEFEKKIADCLVKFGVLSSDPTSIEATQL